ncbi:MAG: DNA alkylation repair protein [Candidatus Pacebacteria bacterium]|nr:DNA alkylation repair protein [Candidatus Paceibacterota bacterium]
MTCEAIVKKLKGMANTKNIEGMERFGIHPKDEKLGVSMPDIRGIGKGILREIKNDKLVRHTLAQNLWDIKIHEVRILASIIDSSEMVDEEQMEKWVGDFDSWDLCDQVCMDLFDKVPFAFRKAREYALREEEFVKRAGFALMASLAVHDKKAQDSEFIKFLPLIKKASTDERNFVRKAVNWALRQIGKRNSVLNKRTIKVSEEIQRIDNKAAKWIANDALRELTSPAIQKRLRGKS